MGYLTRFDRSFSYEECLKNAEHSPSCKVKVGREVMWKRYWNDWTGLTLQHCDESEEPGWSNLRPIQVRYVSIWIQNWRVLVRKWVVNNWTNFHKDLISAKAFNWFMNRLDRQINELKRLGQKFWNTSRHEMCLYQVFCSFLRSWCSLERRDNRSFVLVVTGHTIVMGAPSHFSHYLFPRQQHSTLYTEEDLWLYRR